MRIRASITLTSPPESNKSEALQLRVGLSCIHYNAAGVVIFKEVCVCLSTMKRNPIWMH